MVEALPKLRYYSTASPHGRRKRKGGSYLVALYYIHTPSGAASRRLAGKAHVTLTHHGICSFSTLFLNVEVSLVYCC